MPPSLLETKAVFDAAVFVRKESCYLMPPSLLEMKAASNAAVYVRNESSI